MPSPNKPINLYGPSARNYLADEIIELDEVRERDDTMIIRQEVAKIRAEGVVEQEENIFDLLNRLREKKNLPSIGDVTMKWYKSAISSMNEKVGVSVEENFLSDKERVISKSTLKKSGQMFMFNYSPIGKDDIPYYDAFPCVFLIDMHKDGFTGLNLHYLPIQLREALFSNLIPYINSNRYDDIETRLKINSYILKKNVRLRYYKPCYKKYLNTRIDSRMLRIPPSDWGIAIYLPLARFIKGSRYAVWDHSRKMIMQSSKIIVKETELGE